MTDDGLRATGRPLNGRYHPPGECPPSALGLAPCGGRRERGTYSPEQLTHGEAGELRQALTDAETELQASGAEIEHATADLLHQESRTLLALHRLDTFLAGRRLATAHAQRARMEEDHRDDGAEDRRHTPRWARIGLIPTVVAAAAYDTAFFSRVFLKVLSAAPGPRSPVFYLSLIPGVVLTTALLTSGHLIARAALRGGYHADRRLERIRLMDRLLALLTRKPPVPRVRSPSDLPWPQWWPALSFATVVLATLGIWAVNRAGARPGLSLATPPGAVALLLLLLSLSAIAVTVVHYNPFADRAAAVEERLTRAEGSREELAARAGEAVTQYGMAAHRLRRLLDELEQRAQTKLDRAWVTILRDRDAHGRAGDLAPPFACPDDGPPPRTFVGVIEPRARLKVLEAARDVVDSCDVEAVRARYEAALAALTAQTAAAAPPGGAPAP